MKKYVAGYGVTEVAFVKSAELPDNASYLGADEDYYYYKANDSFYATIERGGASGKGNNV